MAECNDQPMSEQHIRLRHQLDSQQPVVLEHQHQHLVPQPQQALAEIQALERQRLGQ